MRVEMRGNEGHTNYPLFSLSTYAINKISEKMKQNTEIIASTR